MPRFPVNGEHDPRAASLDAEFAVSFRHRVGFTTGVFNPENPALAEAIRREDGSVAPAIAFIDQGVADAWPDLARRIDAYAAAHPRVMRLVGGPGAVRFVPGGEAAKNDVQLFESMARAIHDAGLCRKSYVLAIGGGALLDVVGFAAATAHRGVRLIRLPTTTLAQDDAGVGVKNGINLFGKKNFLGTFAPPWAVINDERFLSTLSDRDWRSGLSEAVKVALVRDAAFFQRIVAALPRLRRRDHAALMPIVQRSAELHLHHIVAGGDPFELNEARPLDFGHWAAHKIEQMSDFRVKHGEAVAIGIAIDVAYAALKGLLAQPDADQITSCLRDLGFTMGDESLADTTMLLEGLEEFREHLGGRLTITLLRAPGQPVDVHEIDRALMIRAIDQLAAQVT